MDLSDALNPVGSPEVIEENDYVVAVTRDGVYMDRVESVTYYSGDGRMKMQDGVLEPDHSSIEVSRDMSNDNPFNLNGAMDVYRVPEELSPDEAYKQDSLLEAVTRLG